MEPNLFKKLLHRREAGIFFALVGLVILITGFQPNFIKPGNLFLVSRQIALTAIIALGVLFVILTRGIDLSVGSTVGLSGFICGLAMAAGVHPLLAIIAGLLTGVTVGAVNGIIVAYIGVTPFIVTLGMLYVARSAVLVLKHGDSVREISRGFIACGNGRLFGVSVPVLILLVIAGACYLVLGRTVFGRQVFAVGGNEKAAALSGVNTRRVKVFTYILSGLLSAVTGILYVARFESAQADAGKGVELDAIAAAVIGGTSLMGGEGSVVGVLIGATIMGVINSGLVMMQVSSYWHQLIIGAIIVLASILDVIRSRKRP